MARPDGGDEDLGDPVLPSEPVGTRTLTVPARGGAHRRRERVAGDVRTDSPVPMRAVAARAESPPARVRRPADTPGGPRHGLLLIAPGVGTADRATATTVLGGSALRGRLARFVQALRQGTRIEDRHLDSTDDLRKCFAFDAITVLWVLATERFVVRTGGRAGFHPAKRQPLPGTETLGPGVRTLFESVLAIRAWENSKVQMTDAESGVLH